eukprot:scaffold30330_cov67-Skeletonema_dohrnii-CCMP3373.AAC.1
MQDWSSQRDPNPNHDPPTSVGLIFIVAATATVIRQGLSAVSARASVDFALSHPLKGESLHRRCYCHSHPSRLEYSISSCIGIGRLCTEPPSRGGKTSSVADTAIVVIRQGLSTVSAHGQESARASVDFALIPLKGGSLHLLLQLQVSPPPPDPVDLSTVSVDFAEPPPRGLQHWLYKHKQSRVDTPAGGRYRPHVKDHPSEVLA